MSVRCQKDAAMLQAFIIDRAYELWESEGCPTGREIAHWLRAKELFAVPEASNDAGSLDDLASLPGEDGLIEKGGSLGGVHRVTAHGYAVEHGRASPVGNSLETTLRTQFTSFHVVI